MPRFNVAFHTSDGRVWTDFIDAPDMETADFACSTAVTSKPIRIRREATDTAPQMLIYLKLEHVVGYTVSGPIGPAEDRNGTG